MLLAVEGGGFFSSSASGYSKGLTLLLLGQKNEEKPMRVLPWNNQYQLVDQGPNPDSNLQLASKKNRLSRGCASFICFGRSAAGLDSSSPLKVGLSQQQDILSGPQVSDKGKDHMDDSTDESDFGKSVPKSNLKKHSRIISESVRGIKKHEALCERESPVSDSTGRRSVQWTDTSGGELVEIREFEPSDSGGSDDEFDYENRRKCFFRIL